MKIYIYIVCDKWSTCTLLTTTDKEKAEDWLSRDPANRLLFNNIGSYGFHCKTIGVSEAISEYEEYS